MRNIDWTEVAARIVVYTSWVLCAAIAILLLAVVIYVNGAIKS